MSALVTKINNLKLYFLWSTNILRVIIKKKSYSRVATFFGKEMLQLWSKYAHFGIIAKRFPSYILPFPSLLILFFQFFSMNTTWSISQFYEYGLLSVSLPLPLSFSLIHLTFIFFWGTHSLPPRFFKSQRSHHLKFFKSTLPPAITQCNFFTSRLLSFSHILRSLTLSHTHTHLFVLTLSLGFSNSQPNFHL